MSLVSLMHKEKRLHLLRDPFVRGTNCFFHVALPEVISNVRHDEIYLHIFPIKPLKTLNVKRKFSSFILRSLVDLIFPAEDSLFI